MKYRRYAEYKDSGVEWLGEVPAHWCIRRAKHVSTVFVPQRNKPELNAFGGHYWLTMDDMVGAEIHSTHNYVSEDAATKAGSRILPSGSVIASCVGTFAVAAINRVPAIINQQLQAYIPSGIKPEYLRYVVTISESYFLRAATAATIEYINQEKFGDLPLPVPSTSEQSAITAFLDRETAQIDALIAKQERLIAVLQEKRQALISHAVTKGLNPNAPMKDSGVEWLGEVPAHWEVKRLKSLVTDSAAGPYGSSLTKAVYTQEGYRVYGQQQVISDDFEVGDYYISEGQYQQMFQYRVLPGDVLVSVVGTTGRVAVVPDNVAPGIINPRLVRYRPDFSKVRSRYLQAALRSQTSQAQLSQHATGSTMDVLNMEILGSVNLAIPPLPEQDMILDWLRDETERIFTTVVATELGVELLHERRSALISAAVTGKIDVRTVPQ